MDAASVLLCFHSDVLLLFLVHAALVLSLKSFKMFTALIILSLLLEFLLLELCAIQLGVYGLRPEIELGLLLLSGREIKVLLVSVKPTLLSEGLPSRIDN